MENTAIQDFVTASLTGEASIPQQELLKAWLAASADNRLLYEDLKQIWKTAGTLPRLKFDNEVGWEELMYSVSPKKNRRWLKVAAVLLPLFIIAAYYFYQTSDAGWTIYTARGAAKDSLLLPDGSRVYLRQGSVLSYKNREVILENGEVFFNVVQDEKHPFIIKAGKATIRVLGTSFNVKRTPVYADVTVWDGSVSLGAGMEMLFLGKGKMGFVDQATGQLLRKEGNYEYRCAWANNDLAFNNQSLKLILEELSASYHVQLTATDTTILRKNFTIRFKEMPLADALSLLSETTDFDIRKDTADTYLLTERHK
jgi:ferric-dicitrate binding protein FerR (iron transport regulator)